MNRAAFRGIDLVEERKSVNRPLHPHPVKSDLLSFAFGQTVDVRDILHQAIADAFGHVAQQPFAITKRGDLVGWQVDDLPVHIVADLLDIDDRAPLHKRALQTSAADELGKIVGVDVGLFVGESQQQMHVRSHPGLQFDCIKVRRARVLLPQLGHGRVQQTPQLHVECRHRGEVHITVEVLGYTAQGIPFPMFPAA